MLSSGDNRRRHRRVRVHIQIKMAKTTSELATVEVNTKDISMGGACIEFNESISSYSMVKLCIDSVDHKHSIEVEARVLWVKDLFKNNDFMRECEYRYQAGLQFMNLHTLEAKQVIEGHIKSRRRRCP